MNMTSNCDVTNSAL